MACRFPGARNLQELRQKLFGEAESIARHSDQEMIEAGISAAFPASRDCAKAATALDDPEPFDAAFFGFSASEADDLDPQHRLLLELAHVALEDAACDPDRFPGGIGVFASPASNPSLMKSGLNARLTVQTACSTSLGSIHLARQSLLNEEIDMALAGGADARVPHRAGNFHDASGGVIVMRRLADALSQGDPIHAVIKGSAVSDDSSVKAGRTALNVDGQADVIVEALVNSGVNPESISYIETDGLRTPMEDPVEILALTKAFRNFTQRNGYCAIGSVKTNMGCLDSAGGIAGLIKTVLALKHRVIPPALHQSELNPKIDFLSTPFYLNTKAVEWAQSAGPRRAGVMACRMGATYTHVILEEAPAVTSITDSEGPYVLVLSAKTRAALDAMSGNLADFLASSSVDLQRAVSHSPSARSVPPAEADGRTRNVSDERFSNSGCLDDTAHTLQMGRRHFSCRRFIVCSHTKDAVAALKAIDSKKGSVGSVRNGSRRPVVFLLPGVGDHYVGMGQGLYEHFGVFRQEIDRCAKILQPFIETDVRELLYPRDRVRKEPAKSRGIDLKRMLGQATDEPPDATSQMLDQTVNCHPALFCVEYALAQLWLSWGVQPDRIVGHSMGEYVAACLAGVFTLEDALRLVAVRAKLVNDLPRGSMLAVMQSEDKLLPLLGKQLSISLINGPNLCVVAGPVADMSDFQSRLKEREIIFRPVRNVHAFHSKMLEPILDSFAREVKQVRPNVPRIPFTSNVTGTWITEEQALDPSYWVDHARRTARFSGALGQLWKLPDVLPLEVGPGRTLGVLAMQHPARSATTSQVSLSSLRHEYENQPDSDFILNTVGQLWLAGVEIDWVKLEPRRSRRKVFLPTYPFERQRQESEPCVDRKPQTDTQSSTTQQPVAPSAPVASEATPLTLGGEVKLQQPGTDTEIALEKIWSDALGLKQVGILENFFEIGGHSLQAMRVIAEVQRRFGKSLPIASLFTAPTILQFSRLLDENAVAVPSFSGGLRGNGTGAPLFFIPGNSGYEFIPRELARNLHGELRYYDGLQYPGLHGKEAMPGSIEEIAAYLAPQIQSVWPHGPYFLCGWSNGGVVAFEVARQMESRGVKVELLFLLDSRVPELNARKRSFGEIADLFRRHMSTLSLLERAAFFSNLAINKLAYWFSSRGFLPIKPDNDAPPLIEAVRCAMCNYRPGSYGGHVVLFQIDDWEFYEGFRFAVDPTYGWGELVRNGLEVIRVPGDHFSMMNKPAAAVVAQRLRTRLEQNANYQTLP